MGRRRHWQILQKARRTARRGRRANYSQTLSRIRHSCNDDEIAYSTEVKIGQLRQSRNVGNLVGVLITAVPEYFVEPAHELHHYRSVKAAEVSRNRKIALKTLDDPTAREEDKSWATRILAAE